MRTRDPVRMQGVAYLESPVGCLRIKTHNDAVVEVEFVDAPGEDVLLTPAAEQALSELNEYFAGKRTHFSVPLSPRGTVFQETIWQLLQQIPHGRAVSYSALAQKLGKPGALRAVGQANHTNPIAIMIPCHRVVGLDRA